MTNDSRAFAAAVSAAAATLFPIAPAHADHPVASAGGAIQSGGLQVAGPETLSGGTSVVQLTTSFVKPKRRSDSALTELAGHHVHAHTSDYGLRTALTGAFGLSDRLTISASVPFVRQDEFREGEHGHGHGGAINSVVDRGSVSGIGDATLLAKYRLRGRDVGGLALLAGVKAPTGSTRKQDISGERFETEHQPGSGGWDLLMGAAAGVPVGSLRLDGSLMYQLAGRGAQRTRLGDRLVAGLALSRRFAPSGDHHSSGESSDPHEHSSWDAFTEVTAEWEDRQMIDGAIDRHSGGKAIYLSPGVRLNTTSNWSVAAQIGIPVRQRIGASHPNTGVRFVFALARGF